MYRTSKIPQNPRHETQQDTPHEASIAKKASKRTTAGKLDAEGNAVDDLPEWVIDRGAPLDWAWPPESAESLNPDVGKAGSKHYVAVASRSSDGAKWLESDSWPMLTRGNMTLTWDSSGQGTGEIYSSLGTGKLEVKVDDRTGRPRLLVEGADPTSEDSPSDRSDGELNILMLKSGARFRTWQRYLDEKEVEITVELGEDKKLGAFLWQDEQTGHAIVRQITPGSAAALGGLQFRDAMTSFGGTPLTNENPLTKALGAAAAGAVTLKVIRGDWAGIEQTFELGEGCMLLTAFWWEGCEQSGFETIFAPVRADGRRLRARELNGGGPSASGGAAARAAYTISDVKTKFK